MFGARSFSGTGVGLSVPWNVGVGWGFGFAAGLGFAAGFGVAAGLGLAWRPQSPVEQSVQVGAPQGVGQTVTGTIWQTS